MSRAIIVQTGGGFERVTMGEAEAADPGAGEIRVRLHANSLNYHDYAVVSGMWGPQAPRIPMADGAGEVTAVGPGVSEFAVGDSVVSTFFPDWIDGEPTMDSFVPRFPATASTAMRAKTSRPRPSPSPMRRNPSVMPKRRR